MGVREHRQAGTRARTGCSRRAWPIGALPLAVCGLATAMLAAPAHATPPAPGKGVTAVGPPEARIWVTNRARMQVRGDRPDGASIHVAYATRSFTPDADLRAALRRFEADNFPKTLPPTAKTIIDEPPQAWMRQLEPPGMPVRWNQKTVDYLEYFRQDPQGQALAAAWLRRMGRYGPRIKEILREVGVPEDLAYVAMIESGFHPEAKSRVGAAGMWQFMEPTGAVYGLDVDYWEDSRLDFERSTYAAATYLADLHTRFGTWELALAAYNAGYGLVVKTIRQNNTNNFWALAEIEGGLPSQTVNYVPKFLAVAMVGRNPEVFGVDIDPLPRLDAVAVEVPGGARLDDVSTALGIDRETLSELNAQLVRGRTPPVKTPSGQSSKTERERDGVTKIRIPKSAVPKYRSLPDKLALAPDEATTVVYEVRLGEDLQEVAYRHAMTEKELRRLNAVHDSGEVGPGTLLILPRPKPDLSLAPLPKPLVAVPKVSVPPDRRLVFLRVTRAATPRAIAKALSVPWSQVVAWNDLDPHARLVDGQYLQVVVPGDFDPRARVFVREVDEVVRTIRGTAAHLDAALEERGLTRRGYIVKSGETMAKIAKRFGLSLGSLARINGVQRNHSPDPGDRLVLHVDAAHRRGTVEAPPPKKTSLTRELGDVQAPDSKDESRRDEGRRSPSTAETAKVPGQGR